jgi:DNA polymerase-3 subunit beta
MKHTFSIEQKELLDLLASMQPICSRKTTLDITESVFFSIAPRELTLKATDLEISLQSTMPVESSGVETHSFLVAGKRIFELIKELDGQIEFTLQSRLLKLKAAGVDLALNIKSAEDFPPFPERIENLMQLDAQFLLSLLNKVAFLIPQNNANSALNGMLLQFRNKTMSFVATDGHCLAMVSTPKYVLAEDKKWLLPKRAVMELKKILEVSDAKTVFLGTCGNQLVFSGSTFNFFTKLIADPFPQYESVMDKEGFRPACITKNTFVKTLKRAGCLLAGQFISTTFAFKPGNVDVTLNNREVGKLEESLDLQEFEGATVESRFYSPYLLNGLQVFPKEEASFYIKDNSKPIIFEADEKDYHLIYLVMPISATTHT